MIILNEHKNQLCNRLFALVPAMAFALENEEELVVLYFPTEYLSIFPNLTKDERLRFVRPIPHLSPKGMDKLAYITTKIIGRMATWRRKAFSFRKVSRNRVRLLFVRGWKDRLAPSFIAEHHASIKQLFEPDISVSRALEQAFGTTTSFITIGVHVRRGDYREYKGGRYFFADEVYRRVMDEVAQIFEGSGRRVRFLVCSNEPVARPLVDGLTTLDLPAASAIADLYGLSCCDYIIGPPSTYSQWASFIGKVPLAFIHAAEEKIGLSDFRVVSSLDRFGV